MKRIARGRVVKRQVHGVILKRCRKGTNSSQKFAHPDRKDSPDEDAFLPDDSTEQVFEDNVDPKVKALMQR